MLRGLLESGHAHSFPANVVSVAMTNSELVKLYPWTEHEYDGFPRKWLAFRVTFLALLEDFPQLVCQLVFMITVDASAVAVASFVVTIIDLLWRVIKRSLRVMAVDVQLEARV